MSMKDGVIEWAKYPQCNPLETNARIVVDDEVHKQLDLLLSNDPSAMTANEFIVFYIGKMGENWQDAAMSVLSACDMWFIF